MNSPINLELFSIPVVAYDEDERICGENALALKICNAVSYLGKPLLLLSEDLTFSHSIRVLFEQDNLTIAELVAKQDPRRISGVMRIEHELITPLDRLRSKLFKMDVSNEDLDFFEKTFLTLRKKIQSITFEMSFRNGDMQLYDSSECNIVELLGHLASAVNSYYDCELVKLHAEESIIPIKCDENKLLHALLQILNNSVKMASEEIPLEITIAVYKDSESIVITISDNGKGFSTDDYETLTEAYSQASNSLSEHIPGLGVGLYLVKKIVSLHRGKLEFCNNPNGGASVKMVLPQAKEEGGTVFKAPQPLLSQEEIKDRTFFMLVDVPKPNTKRDD